MLLEFMTKPQQEKISETFMVFHTKVYAVLGFAWLSV